MLVLILEQRRAPSPAGTGAENRIGTGTGGGTGKGIGKGKRAGKRTGTGAGTPQNRPRSPHAPRAPCRRGTHGLLPLMVRSSPLSSRTFECSPAAAISRTCSTTLMLAGTEGTGRGGGNRERPRARHRARICRRRPPPLQNGATEGSSLAAACRWPRQCRRGPTGVRRAALAEDPARWRERAEGRAGLGHRREGSAPLGVFWCETRTPRASTAPESASCLRATTLVVAVAKCD